MKIENPNNQRIPKLNNNTKITKENINSSKSSCANQWMQGGKRKTIETENSALLWLKLEGY